MKKILMTPREFVHWFLKHNYKGEKPDFVITSSGRKIMLNDMTEDDANFVAQQFMLMAEETKGNS